MPTPPIRRPCDYRDCGATATLQLRYGIPTPAPAHYCQMHAERVRELFVVEAEKRIAPAPARPRLTSDGFVATTSPSAATHANGRKTHCKNNHPFTVENTYVSPNGRRHCRTCMLALDRRRYGYQGLGRPETRDRCPQGHLYDEANTHIYTRPDGGTERRCRACGRGRWRKSRDAAARAALREAA